MDQLMLDIGLNTALYYALVGKTIISKSFSIIVFLWHNMWDGFDWWMQAIALAASDTMDEFTTEYLRKGLMRPLVNDIVPMLLLYQ